MRIKLDGKFSTARACNGEAPHGTKTGNFLFSATVASLDRIRPGDEPPEDVSFIMPDVADTEEDPPNLSRYDRSLDFSSNVSPFDRRTLRSTNPLDDTAEHPFNFFWDRAHIEARLPLPDRWIQKETKNYNYVDDQSLLEFSPLSTAISSLSTAKEAKHVHASQLSSECQRTEEWAKSIGMQLNLSKTQLLCITGSINYEVNSYLKINRDIIDSGQTLKILGYHLSSKPDCSAQYDDIRRKAAMRAWLIRHLKKLGVPPRDLVDIYGAFVRSSNTYGGFLTTTQSQGIKRIQASVLSTIFGPKNAS